MNWSEPLSLRHWTCVYDLMPVFTKGLKRKPAKLTRLQIKIQSVSY